MNLSFRTPLALLVLGLSLPLTAAQRASSAATGDAVALGFDPVRLQRLDAVIQDQVDPQERIVALFMTQHRPSGGNDLNQKFKVLIYQALK